MLLYSVVGAWWLRLVVFCIDCLRVLFVFRCLCWRIVCWLLRWVMILFVCVDCDFCLIVCVMNCGILNLMF